MSTDVSPTFPDLRGKVTVVTGGSRGIGAATCAFLAANGARVAVCSRSDESSEAVVVRLRDNGHEAFGFAADLTRHDEVARLRATIEGTIGPADVLMAFAGGPGSRRPITQVNPAEWASQIASNLTSAYFTLGEFLRGMVQRGRGTVVTMSSAAGRLADPALSAGYAAAKAGVVQLTRHAAVEVAAHGVRVNCVAPATVESERVEQILADNRALRAQITGLTPLGRLGSPQDVAVAATFLASEASGWLTGVTLDVAGGRVML